MKNYNFNKVNCDLQYVIYPLEIKHFQIEMQTGRGKAGLSSFLLVKVWALVTIY